MAKRTPKLAYAGPDNAVKITTYTKLQQVAQDFALGKLGNVLIVGPPGMGKTYTFRLAVQQSSNHRYAYLNNHAAPFGLYTKVWQYTDMPLIIDDIRAINSNPASVGVLMAVCDSNKPKLVTWTTNNLTPDTEPPSSFETNSDVALITNAWDTLNERVKALEDRCMCYHFVPSSHELHRYVGSWFKDQSIYDWMATRIYQVKNPSIRSYEKAMQLRDSGAADWQDDAAAMIGVDPELALVIKLELDKSLKPGQRVARFKQQTKLSPKTYYRRRIEAQRNTPGGHTKLVPPKFKLPKPKNLPKLVNAQPLYEAVPSLAERADGIYDILGQVTKNEGERAKLVKMLGTRSKKAKAKKAAKANKTKGKAGKKKN